MAKRDWTHDEIRLAYFLYCQLPFGRLHGRNPEIIALAKLLDRSPGAVAMKLVNLASLDQNITATGRVGLKNASKLDKQVWQELHHNWDQFAEQAISQRQYLEKSLADYQAASTAVSEVPLPQTDAADYSANNRQSVVMQREKQSFFRRTVLNNYNQRCCMTDLAEPQLLIASHIIPWSEDPTNRLNPANGLCLSALHDKAFDQHLISLDENYRILIGDKLKRRRDENFVQTAFLGLEGKQISLPERFSPNLEFLARHRELALVSE